MDTGLGGMDLAELARKLAFALVPMILSLSVHEFAHAFCAYKLGDTTARDAGRLTLNPQAHIDPWGTLFIPALSVLMGGVAFLGWARPTPVRADRFRDGVNRRFGSALVSAAGPVSNLLLALLTVGTMAVLTRIGVGLYRPVEIDGEFILRRTPLGLLLYSMFTLNIALAFFNLLPIPPLDGHRLLPPVLDPIVRPLSRYGFAILIGIFLMLPRVAMVLFYRPLGFVTEHVEGWFGVI
jgi:Zn-dependent protease